MHLRRRKRQLRVDSRCERVDKFGPFRVEEPKSGSAFGAKVASASACLTDSLVVGDPGSVNPQCPTSRDVQRFGVAHDVDGKTASAGRLAADRAIAKLVRIGRMTKYREANASAA